MRIDEHNNVFESNEFFHSEEAVVGTIFEGMGGNFYFSPKVMTNFSWKELASIAEHLEKLNSNKTGQQATTGVRPMSTIDISGMDKAEVLAKLFNASKAQGMGFLQPHQKEMTSAEA